MTWIALNTSTGITRFNPDGIASGAFRGRVPNRRLTRGTILIETTMPDRFNQPQDLIDFRRTNGYFHALRLSLGPKGRLALASEQDRVMFALPLDLSRVPRDNRLRISYAWDTEASYGLLSAEDLDTGAIWQARHNDPHAIPLEDLGRITFGHPAPSIGGGVTLFAVSDAVEPVGFAQGVTAGSLVTTEHGWQPVDALRVGDLVRTRSGALAPLIAKTVREVPAAGYFAPITVEKPYLGLLQSLTVSPDFRLLVDGADTEYLFHDDSVLVSAAALASAGAPSKLRATGGVVRYHHLLLETADPIQIGGLWTAPIHVGTLYRDPGLLATTPLAHVPAARLPRHLPLSRQVLNPLEAIALVAQRDVQLY